MIQSTKRFNFNRVICSFSALSFPPFLPRKSLYPKVKVRVQDLDDQDDDFSFSWIATTSPGEYQSDSPKCVVRVPPAQLPNEQLHPTQEPKVVDQKDRKSDVTDRLNTRATSVTRPRAVLSSPDNDEMIGNNNSKRVIQPSPLRNHNVVQKRHLEHRIIPLHTTQSLIGNGKTIECKNSKRVVTPSPLRNHNMVQKPHMEHKIVHLQTTSESSIDTGKTIGSKNSKRVVTPSPLPNHNMVPKPHIEHKIVHLQTTSESPIDNGTTCESKNSKRMIQPSPLRNRNMVQKRHLESKIIPLQTSTNTPVGTRHKHAYAVDDHTPSTTSSTQGKPKTAKDYTLSKVKQLGMVSPSQKAKVHKANSII